MSDEGEEFGYRPGFGSARPATGPEQWLGGPDPVESFGSTIEQALNRLNVELAGLRAERDGMRLELEGLRAQLQVTQQQLADRDRFAATVRELGHIVQQLSAPSRWPGDPAAMAAAQVLAPPPQPVYAAPPPPVAPTPEPVADVPPPEAPVATPAPVVPDPAPAEPPAPAAEPIAVAPVVPAPPVAEPVPAPPVAEPEPAIAPIAAPAPEPAPAPPVEEPVAAAAAPIVEPEPVADPGPEPIHSSDFAMPSQPPSSAFEPAPSPSYSFGSGEIPQARTSVLANAEENFFSGPGVWIGEPPKADDRRTALKTWATRVGSAVAGLIVLMVFMVSIGPKFLPYQMFFVRSGSMSGTFETGDMILLTKANASDLKPRDIITFDRPDKPGTLVTHRIVSIETNEQGRQFVTKGDANDAPDPWRVPASGDGWKYKMKIPKLGFLFGYLGTPQARLALLAIPACLLGILSLIDIWKPQPKARGRR